ncbi:hypothetical protein BGW39_000862 [Mortierella sp. 14UC]|nr:hypothetical protein BGW39_000862 [Mortierella sp. 14UC]
MSIFAASVDCVKEITLKVASPLFGENSSQQIVSTKCAYNSTWTINLTRAGETLTIDVAYNRGSHLDYTIYNSMLILPHEEVGTSYCVLTGTIQFIAAGSHKGVIEAEKVIKDGNYRFDIVFCGSEGLLRKPALVTTKNMDIVPLLLKDARSADVCFTFTSDKAYSNIGLWAHRVVLTRHKVFAKLFQHQDELQALVTANDKDDKAAAMVESDVESTCTVSAEGNTTPSPTNENRSLVIKVDKFSLATFCALMYYIYTDEVHLTIDTDRFAISSGEGSLVWRDSTTGKTRDSVRWHPTDPASPWKLKDVTWDELLEAADHYGISDLRADCLAKVISGMNHSNVVGTLFSKAVNGSEVRMAAMEYIVKHWGAIFHKGNADPFAAYREHPDCHEVLIDLMQLKAKKL